MIAPVIAEPVTDELRALIALVQTRGLGPRRIDQLLSRCGSAQAALAAGERLWSELRLPADSQAELARPHWHGVDQTLHWAEHESAWLLARSNPAYPPRLAEIASAPPLLFGLGDPALLCEPQLGVVGSRNPTASGAETTREFAAALAGLGLVITSGLAMGIDSAAHQGALTSGCTIAVLGTGPDRIYPQCNRELARHILKAGALVTEFPPGVGPHSSHFPRRNRIISGLSLGVLVTEAAPRSGSLITARYAVEQGREVFAIPGSIHNPLARGCHALIRDGAKLIDSIDQLLEELQAQLKPLTELSRSPAGAATGLEVTDQAGLTDGLDADQHKLLDLLGYDPITPDELIQRSQMPAREVASTLLLLELQGLVNAHPGGRYSRS
ncbi:DNA-processing protein DprA [Thiorhodovibrio frisius]|uniref:DNA protecting protein DprA n=1 Tax=Thiorhodovibrio frisius TaxID=631362 RepID=H8YX85_9GAMM|nr:DNA-processing protein DprA [Thiorhodovibrio frisius]EIC23061.1 DNA protecting protein DprA [Thiorhodovibrio frisius]WPL22674.1 DNA protecting protein DprA [Thiorhodovibrio frisius]